MSDYISREAALSEVCHGCSIDYPCDPCEPPDCEIKTRLVAIPAAEVVSRKAYLDAIGTINQAHLYPERSAEIIDEFLGRYHALCMEK